VRIVVHAEADVPVELRRQVIALQDEEWPSERPGDLAPWHDPSLYPVSMLLVDADRVVAALDVLSKDLFHVGVRYAASGVSAVVTDPARRGEGHGVRLARAARGLMEDRGADLGIFTCDRHLQAFYERAGWDALEGTVLVGGTPEEPFPSDALEKVTMAAFFSDRARAAAPRFAGARIELYPGRIDKLW
jgi:aminoglycoside 2'-N-acetyltransferase I